MLRKSRSAITITQVQTGVVQPQASGERGARGETFFRDENDRYIFSRVSVIHGRAV